MEEKKKLPLKAAVSLCIITMIAGIALGGVNFVTRDRIAELQLLAENAAYLEVMPGATGLQSVDEATAVIEGLAGEVYGTDYGKSYVEDVLAGTDDSGNVVGYALKVRNQEAFDGSLTVAVGIAADGTVMGISFTEINETAGMGMNADTDSWKGQFKDKNVAQFNLIKGGAASGDDEINAVSGATVTSNSVVHAVNAALGFFAENLQ